jgi:hypothetical protein
MTRIFGRLRDSNATVLQVKFALDQLRSIESELVYLEGVGYEKEERKSS